ncbi:MAG TPA: phosphatase PAP2 family protein [Anaeromyxobacter sp.]
MPPLYQDPLSAVPGAWRWIDLARALVEVSTEAWAIAVIALAVYSFLEVEVRGVLKVFLPLAVALGAATLFALAARSVGGLPHPVEGAGLALGPLLRRAFPSGQAAAVAVFATYSALVYGRRAIAAVVLAVLVGLAHVLAGPHWGAGLAGGGVLGVALGASAWALTIRAVPGGHVATRRPRRSPGATPTGPGSP